MFPYLATLTISLTPWLAPRPSLQEPSPPRHSTTPTTLTGKEAGAGDRAIPAAEEFYEVVKVVDGDTIYILRDGHTEKLRLLSVDTEERLLGHGASASKPETVFGEECALWAQDFFASLAEDGQKPRVALRFPEGREQRDVYGRLLCDVILPDGRDFNLLLVQLGKSPYFNKYGNSLIRHADFVAAQRAAREAQLGIWNPATNKPADPQAPSARRPYERLLPWWQMRADAIEEFRALHAREPEVWIAADDAQALEAAVARQQEVEIFGQIRRFFDEPDGSRTVLFRSGDKRRALRVHIPADQREAYAAIDLDASLEEYAQNYLFVSGTLSRGERGFDLSVAGPSAWRRAGPRAGAGGLRDASSPRKAGESLEAGGRQGGR